MKPYFISIILLFTASFSELAAQNPQKQVIYENIEWTNVWIPSAPKNDLPRVLLIGNSITQGYYPVVETSLKGKAYIARYTTSRGIIDPALFNEIKNLVAHHSFDVIHFNNGLHGIAYSPAQYESGLDKLVRLLKKHAKGAVLIGATSTAVLPGFKGWKSDEFNQNLILTRNEILFKVCRNHNIEVNDLYPVTASQAEWFSPDKIHYNEQGKEALGRQTAAVILKALDSSGKK